MSAITGPVQGALAAGASKEAAKIQQETALRALQQQMDMFNISNELLEPFRQAELERLQFTQAGEAAFTQALQEGPGVFEESEFFRTAQSNIDLAISESANALAKAGAATGQGGALGKQLARFAAPFAAQELSNRRGQFVNEFINLKLNPLAQQAQVGASPQAGTTALSAQNALQAGQQFAQTTQFGGQAAASGILGSAAALQQGISNVSAPFQQVGAELGAGAVKGAFPSVFG